MNYLFAIILAATTILAALPAAAQDIDRREHIDVIGSAEIKVVPNEFVLHSTVESFDKSLTKASKQNDALVAKIFKEITRLGVARKYVVTSEVSVNAVTTWVSDGPYWLCRAASLRRLNSPRTSGLTCSCSPATMMSFNAGAALFATSVSAIGCNAA